MNARLMAIGTIGALALAAYSVSPQISAQPAVPAGGGGIFASLKVGQMVEYKNDAWGSPMITTYDDDVSRPLMKHKVRGIGHDYISLEYVDVDATGAVVEFRLSAHRMSVVAHVGKSEANPGHTDRPGDKSDKPATKPGTPKKKN